MKKFGGILILFLLLSGCTAERKKEKEIMVKDLSCIHETEFGGVYLGIGIEDFNALGFAYGDSVDVLFSNGYVLEDLPYYNGYYVDAGKPLLIAYPGYEYIKAAVNYGEDLWESANLKMDLSKNLWVKADLEEHDSAQVVLREKGKYLDIQNARDISYTDEITDYPDVIAFANFRNVRMGKIKEGILYRSASPCDNSHKRAPYVDELMKEAGVSYILDLADSEVKIERYLAADDFSSDYFLSLYEEGKVFPLALNMNYLSQEFKERLTEGLISLSQHEGPYLVHCTEGKDRTGFVCILLEMLMGCEYGQIIDDYMKTYDNYYQINETEQGDKYRTIKECNADAMIAFIINDEKTDMEKSDLSSFARAYLLEGGMSEEQVDSLIEKLGGRAS